VTSFRAPHIGVQILEPEGQLSGIEALGAAAELRALKLLDDAPETVDLASRVSTTAAMSRTRRCRRSTSAGRFSRSRRMSDSTRSLRPDQPIYLIQLAF
jgi:hypothetical protein